MPTRSERPPLLTTVLRKYWWTLIPIFALSGLAAYHAAQEFGKESSLARASVIHRGLPGAPGPTIYEPLSPKTCSELMTSVGVLREVLADRSLEMPSSALAELITVSLTRNSSLIDVELAWGSPEDGIGLLNDLLDEFIVYVADERRSTLNEHIKHVELALLQAKGEVDMSRTKVAELRRRQQQQLIESGGYSEDLYAGLLNNVANTRFAIDDERAEQIGLDQQIEQLKQKQADLNDSLREAQERAIGKLVAETTRRLKMVAAGYAPGSKSARQLTALIEEVEAMSETGDDPNLQVWSAEMSNAITASPVRLSGSAIDGINLAQAPVLAEYEQAADAIGVRLRDAERTLENLQLRKFPVGSKISVMENRLEQLKDETEEIGEPLVGFDSSRLEDAEFALQDAETHQQALALQLASMRQLEKCRVNEWTVSVPAGPETTSVSSNRTKIGALAFGLCTLGLFTPFVLGEMTRRRDDPEVAFAQSVGLPIVADRVLPDLRVRSKPYRCLDDLNPERIEKIRRFALRIQQSCNRTDRGSTIVFSSLDPGASAAPLISAIAECLTEREERVLLINASPADRTLSWVAPVEPATEANGRLPHLQDAADPAPGLAEYLAAECSEATELTHPTGLPGVDAIYCGERSFPREAMASSCLTRLIEASCERYSMVLINGPSAVQSADLQMLAAHADGVVFTASRRMPQRDEARAAVADMLNLNAPIIGVVS